MTPPNRKKTGPTFVLSLAVTSSLIFGLLLPWGFGTSYSLRTGWWIALPATQFFCTSIVLWALSVRRSLRPALVIAGLAWLGLSGLRVPPTPVDARFFEKTHGYCYSLVADRLGASLAASLPQPFRYLALTRENHCALGALERELEDGGRSLCGGRSSLRCASNGIRTYSQHNRITFWGLFQTLTALDQAPDAPNSEKESAAKNDWCHQAETAESWVFLNQLFNRLENFSVDRKLRALAKSGWDESLAVVFERTKIPARLTAGDLNEPQRSCLSRTAVAIEKLRAESR